MPYLEFMWTERFKMPQWRESKRKKEWEPNGQKILFLIFLWDFCCFFSDSLSMLPLKDSFGMCVVFVHFSKRAFKRRQMKRERKNWKWSVNKSFLRRFFSLSISLVLYAAPISSPRSGWNNGRNLRIPNWYLWTLYHTIYLNTALYTCMHACMHCNGDHEKCSTIISLFSLVILLRHIQ